MTHISKQPITNRVAERIEQELLVTIESLSPANAKLILFELLSKTERIMLAKRLAVIHMLIEDIPYRDISNILKVSTSTVDRIDNDLQSGEFDALKRHLKKKKQRDAFWNDMEVLLRGGLPEMGKNRWKWLNDI